MELYCPYCYESFNEQQNVPLKLTCNHVICRECVIYLRDYIIPNSCPFDQTSVDFSKAMKSTEMIDLLRKLCHEHNREITGICTIHYSKLCDVCAESHTDCKTIIEESFNKLNDKVNQVIETKLIKNSEEPFLFHCLGFGAFSNEITWLKEEYYEFEEAIKPLGGPIESLSQEEKIELINQHDFLKEKSAEVLSKRNSVLLKIHTEENIQSGDINIPGIQELEKLRGLIDFNAHEVGNELGIVKKDQNALTYFGSKNISSALDRNFLAIFHNITTNTMYLITGVGIGLPTIPHTSIYVHFTISLEIGNPIYDEEIVLDYTENRLTQCVPLQKPVLLKSGSSLILYFEIDGEKFNLFHMPVQDDYVKVTDFDGSIYSLNFPVLYLTI